MEEAAERGVLNPEVPPPPSEPQFNEEVLTADAWEAGRTPRVRRNSNFRSQSPWPELPEINLNKMGSAIGCGMRRRQWMQEDFVMCKRREPAAKTNRRTTNERI